MSPKNLPICVMVLGILAMGAVTVSADQPGLRRQAEQDLRDGNFREAFDKFEVLCVDETTDPGLVGQDLQKAIQCLQRLGEVKRFDDLCARTVKSHGKNWRLLLTTAQQYLRIDHHGFMIGGEFERGPHRGNGRVVNSFERDRVRSLQLLNQAREWADQDDDKPAVSTFYMTTAQILQGQRGGGGAWQLQALTNLKELPDYESGYYYRDSNGGAPVDKEGLPVVYYIPKSWEAATNDGERWRWALSQAVENNPRELNNVRSQIAQFARSLFGVETMARQPWFRPASADQTDDPDRPRTYDLDTLEDDETIARLATGVKRFKFPDEYNFIEIYETIVEEPRTGRAENTLQLLASVYENRRQYPRAAEIWRRNIKEYGPGNNDWKKARLEQIVGNWGALEPSGTQPAGTKPSLEYKFRNGKKVTFQAKRLDVEKLLSDIKDYLKSDPKRLDWQTLNIPNIGYRIVNENLDKYFVGEPIEWSEKLDPRENHFDRRVTLEMPLENAGAYWVEATMEKGNSTRVVLWVADSVVVRKNLDEQVLFYAADAVSGEPLSGANLEFFGYRQERVGRTNRFQVLTSNFAETTDRNGLALPKKEDLTPQFQWLTIARQADRLAFLGFQGVWFQKYYDQEYRQVKSFFITDRPVYRPGQAVQFKSWVRQAQYDKDDVSQFAGQTFEVKINNPKGEEVFKQLIAADEYGGLSGVFEIPEDATLGQYMINNQQGQPGGNTFRVEEYKKPEYEVVVKAPEKPVELGETVNATVSANYYFGAPVTDATVKYKVLRSDYSQRWYPTAPWDWCFGPGYWWFGYDYPWYPGWDQWVGCARPGPWWTWQQPSPPPEVVAEAEVPIGPDGKLTIEIDTAVAQAIHGDTDHKYTITAEVRDSSRRTIVGEGQVLVSRKPFRVFAWVDRGYYRVGDVIQSHVKAQTLDGTPVEGSGEIRLFKITYDENRQPRETAVQIWSIQSDPNGEAIQQLKAASPGQYRLSATVKDEQGHTVEGGYVFTVVGEGFDGSAYRFNDLELIPDRREYAPGEQVEMQINTDRSDSTVLFFVRPANGICLPPKVLRMDGKSQIEAFKVERRDMPNMFVEALTVADGRVFTEVKELIVPPEKRVLNVEVVPSAERYEPGEKAKVQVHVTDHTGENFQGSTVVTIFDKSLEYIAGGNQTPDIREFFWKWRRTHQPQTMSSLAIRSNLVYRRGEKTLQSLGVFGYAVADDSALMEQAGFGGAVAGRSAVRGMAGVPYAAGQSMPMAGMEKRMEASADMMFDASEGVADNLPAAPASGGASPGASNPANPTVRSKFADTALWVASLQTDATGMAEVELEMPENLTTWKIKVWGMGHGTKVGSGETEVITSKNLLVRMQAPRFFVEKDEVVLSANIHNYLESAKDVSVRLEMAGDQLVSLDPEEVQVEIGPDGEQRVDWRVKVEREGQAVIRMFALTDEESDAMEMTFPVYLHGAMRQESWAGTLRPDQNQKVVEFEIPNQRRISDSRLEVRYSPTLAGAMVDALPYLVDYPYGCTEQTLNRFLPAVVTQRVLIDMNVDLASVETHLSNLNAQEIGVDAERAKQWKRYDRNPVFDTDEVNRMVKEGLKRIAEMQVSDGGWGWFSGYGERSFPHTTAVVVHGLQVARANDVALVPGLLENGVAWLKRHQEAEIEKLLNDLADKKPRKKSASNIDALVYGVLVDEGIDSEEMRRFLYRDRNNLSVYAKAVFALAIHRVGDAEKLAMLRQNLEQYLVQDEENETAYLKMPEGNYWWNWYGDEIEANAYYLKLLTQVDPNGVTSGRLVKYLLNNRKHATYWGSTRDTSLCIEAFADHLAATGEARPEMVVEVWLDGEMQQAVEITSENLFTFNNKFVLEGAELLDGEHRLELRRRGTGPVYFNTYLTNFNMEDDIPAAGLEVKVQRKFYQLVPVEKKLAVEGDRGQVVDQKVEKFERVEIENLGTVTSGDLVEVELLLESKNDYEYLLFEDYKAAGFEPVDLRSGYNGNEMGAYVEFRDEKVCFFIRQLARGRHSLSYRLRAEVPGKFSALPAQASAMYAPELRGNSAEIKVMVEDQ
ncbi:MAG: MG2 domain-containing protein [Planctomycetota bacterium]|nr:MG2 domain-containing protein [Planctomycetota bacterium]